MVSSVVARSVDLPGHREGQRTFASELLDMPGTIGMGGASRPTRSRGLHRDEGDFNRDLAECRRGAGQYGRETPNLPLEASDRDRRTSSRRALGPFSSALF